MKQHLFHWILAILFILATCAQSQLALDFRATNAMLQNRAGQVILKMKVNGGTAPYRITYEKIPLEWSVRNNDLVLTRITSLTNRVWTFDIIVRDAANVVLTQTVKLFIYSYQLTLSPVTVGKITYPSRASALSGILKIILGSSQASTSSSGNAISTRSFDIQDMINQYPGSVLSSSFGPNTGFNINYSSNSTIVPLVIANAQAKYDPARDGRQITQEQILADAAYLRQSNAEKAVANLLTVIRNLNTEISRGKTAITQLDKSVENAQNASRECKL